MKIGDLVKLIIDDCDGKGHPVLADSVFLVLKMTKTTTGDTEALVQCLSDSSRCECDATNFWVV